MLRFWSRSLLYQIQNWLYTSLKLLHHIHYHLHHPVFSPRYLWASAGRLSLSEPGFDIVILSCLLISGRIFISHALVGYCHVQPNLNFTLLCLSVLQIVACLKWQVCPCDKMVALADLLHRKKTLFASSFCETFTLQLTHSSTNLLLNWLDCPHCLHPRFVRFLSSD